MKIGGERCDVLQSDDHGLAAKTGLFPEGNDQLCLSHRLAKNFGLSLRCDQVSTHLVIIAGIEAPGGRVSRDQRRRSVLAHRRSRDGRAR